jgi:hypothetical protein
MKETKVGKTDKRKLKESDSVYKVEAVNVQCCINVKETA